MEISDQVRVRNTAPRDFAAIGDLCKRIYPDTEPWAPEQLSSHLKMFPEGQFVAVHGPDEDLVGMCASLVVDWEDYRMLDDWVKFTADGLFTNHDLKRGRTLYGAEVIVDPALQHQGVGDKLYCARRELAQRFGLWRIRAGARLRGYHSYTGRLSAEDYIIQVVHGTLHDPTLSFQLKEGFHVLAVVPHYLSEDPESQGYAAVIEWLNPLFVKLEHIPELPRRFLHRDVLKNLDSKTATTSPLNPQT
ncbi:MAG: GNAT family N-acetyltransferase [Candidatus Acidiferrales bacterium]